MPRYEIKSDREVELIARGLIRQFVYSLAALGGIVIISTLGLLLFGRHGDDPIGTRLQLALWDTLNLISTVGSLEEEFTRGQRAWAMIVIVFGLGAVLYAYGNLQGLIQGGDVRRHFVRTRVHRMLEKKRDHVIVCGFGHVGRVVARRIARAGRELVVIEQTDESVNDANEAGYLVIHGDCESEETLRAAGVQRAAGLIATLGTDAANVYLALIARELNPKLLIVSSAEQESSRRTLRQAGVDRIIVPGEMVGMQLSHLVLQPRMSEFIADAIGEGDFDFTEIDVRKYPKLEGRTLHDLNLPDRAQIIVISLISGDGTEVFNPPADRVLTADDTLLAVSHGASLSTLEALESS